MFDTLTLDQLYALHAELCAEVTAISRRLLDSDDRPRIPVFSPEWEVLSAKQAEVHDMAESVLAEIFRREREVVTNA